MLHSNKVAKNGVDIWMLHISTYSYWEHKVKPFVAKDNEENHCKLICPQKGLENKLIEQHGQGSASWKGSLWLHLSLPEL